jgi:hypothetical protein
MAGLLLALSLGLAAATADAAANPLVGTWQGINRSDPNSALMHTLTYKADGTYQSQMVPEVDRDHTGQYFYASGRYQLTGPGSLTYVTEVAAICVAGQGPSSCLPNRAAPNLGVPMQIQFTLDNPNQLTSGNTVYRRVQ